MYSEVNVPNDLRRVVEETLLGTKGGKVKRDVPKAKDDIIERGVRSRRVEEFLPWYGPENKMVARYSPDKSR